MEAKRPDDGAVLSPRMTTGSEPPADEEVAAWLGTEAYGYWQRVAGLIGRLYPGVFRAEWLYGGKKHGWSLPYKKSKPLCTLVPERGRFALLLVFGGDERVKVEAIRDLVSEATMAAYDGATTYHDGKWLFLTVDSDAVVEDAVRLWSVKRRPANGAGQIG